MQNSGILWEIVWRMSFEGGIQKFWDERVNLCSRVPKKFQDQRDYGCVEKDPWHEVLAT